MNPMIWQKESTVSSAFTDSSSRLGVAQTGYLLQDGFTECLGAMGFDGVTIRKRYNACWVVRKSKIHFARRPDWNERIIIKSFPKGNSGVRTHVSTEILGCNGESLIQGTQELCVIHLDTHKLMRLSKLNFPETGFPKEGRAVPLDEDRIRPEDGKLAGIYEQQIYSQHIDMSMHVNNVAYIKLALNLYPTTFFLTHHISDLEADFLGECVEGTVLKSSRVDYKNESVCTIEEGERKVFEMKLLFVPQ